MTRRLKFIVLIVLGGLLSATGFFLSPAQAAGDLVVTKTDNQTTDVPGTSIQYLIRIANTGTAPGQIKNAGITDNFDATRLTNISWSCAVTTATGATTSCESPGTIRTGNITPGSPNRATIDVGGAVTYTVNADILPGATGTLSNTATLSGDPNANGNTATDTTQLVPTGDLGVTKTDNATTEVPGSQVTYTIVYSNSGPSTATNVEIEDFFPNLVPGSVTWSCVGAGGAVCPAPNGSGNINFTGITFPATLTGPNTTVGSSLTFTATGTIPANAEGNSSNTAAIIVPPGFTDPNMDPNTGNNNVKDTNTLVAAADLSVVKACDPGNPIPGETYNCTITVDNLGPSTAQNVVVSDDLALSTTLVGTPSGGGFTCGTGDPFTCTLASLDPASPPLVITYTVRVDENAGPERTLTNTVTVSSDTADPESNNNTSTVIKSTVQCSPGFDFRTASAGVSIQGTNGPDVICGTAFNDTIQGRDGDDVIFGFGGLDLLQGGDGDDTIFGGDGNDTIQGNDDDDTVFGGNGDDDIQGNAGNDTLDGDSGNDAIQGGSGTDTADGGADTDTCTAETLIACNP